MERKCNDLKMILFGAVFMIAILILTSAECSYAEINYIEAGNAAELDEALGGGNIVEGNTVILQHDVETDKTIELFTKEGEIVLDLNNHNITETNEGKQIEEERWFGRYSAALFSVFGSFRVRGEGTVKTTKDHSDIFETTTGSITIDSGDYVTEGNFSFPVSIEGGNVSINGGTFTSLDDERSNLTITNGVDHFPSKTSGVKVNITVNGGSLQSIMHFQDGDLDIKVNGGSIQRIVLDEAKKISFSMTGGEITHGVSLDAYSKFTGVMTGGSIPDAGGGLKIIGGYSKSTFRMTGGTLCSGYLFPLVVRQDRSDKYPMTVDLKGGELISKGSSSRSGLKLIGNVKANIAGTDIKAGSSRKVKAGGIQASAKKILGKRYSPEVTFAKKGTVIRGYTYAYKRCKGSIFRVKKGVKLKAGRKTYTYRRKLPLKIRGNALTK